MALPIIGCIELVDKQRFVAIVLDSEHEIFVVHIASLNSVALPSSSSLDVYPFRRPEIGGFIAKNAFTTIPDKYADFANIFSSDLTSKLFEHTEINDHAIELMNG